MRVNSFLGLLFLMLTVSSCNKSLTAPEYIVWVKEHQVDFVKNLSIGDYKYTCKYIPWQYKLAQDVVKEKVSPDDILEKSKNISGMYYFDLNIDLKDGIKGNVLENSILSDNEFNQRLYYLSYLMKDAIRINTSNGSRGCSLYLFERNFGLKKSIDFTIAFEKRENDGDINLEMNTEIFRTGTVNFQYQKSLIEGMPQIKFD